MNFIGADKLNIPLEDFPGYIERLIAEKDSLIRQIQQIKSEEKLALESHHITGRKLEEYGMIDPYLRKTNN